MKKLSLIFENFNLEYLSKNPKLWAGAAIFLCGFIVLLGAVFNWNWLFEYNKLDKLNSKSLINFYWFQETFGRNVSRVLAGIGGAVIMTSGLVLHFVA